MNDKFEYDLPRSVNTESLTPEHQDFLRDLNSSLPLKDKLHAAHQSMQEAFPFIARIAVAIYDADTAVLKTFIHSSGEDNPLPHYQADLAEAPSLKAMLDRGRPRVINNMVTFENGKHEHTVRLGRQGYAASYTMPIYNQGAFIGFIFFNSYETGVFDEQILKHLDIYGHMIAMLVINELTSIQTLSAAIKTTGSLTHMRDPETGSHLDRMSRYSRIIANALADKYELDDNYVEHVFLFAPLHDIGKIGIPDNILLKPAQLTDEERQVMRTHSAKGRQIIDDFLQNFGLENFEHVDVLRNIAECHHEAVNGSGYPHGLEGDAIPLEARIVAVADVFDALTSERPYKKAWSNDKAIETLQQLAGEILDRDCVAALVDQLPQIEGVQQRFRETM